MIEFALTGMILFGITLVVFNFGVYALAFLSVQNAARSAVLRNSSGIESATDQSSACETALQEMRSLPNIGTGFSSGCGSAPLVVSAHLCPPSGSCAGAAATADGAPAAAVRVTYTMPLLFLVPDSVPRVIQRTVRMKIRNIT